MKQHWQAGLRVAILALAAAGAPALAQPAAAPVPATSGASEARPAPIPIAALTTGSGISDMKMSPDGKFVAVRATGKDGRFVAILDTTTREVRHRIDLPKKSELNWYRWAGSGKLLVAMSAETVFFGEDARISRLFHYDLTTRALLFVGKPEMGLEGDDVLHVDPDGGFVLLSMQRTIYDYPSVWRFDLTQNPVKGAREVQRASDGIWNWFADNTGVVRMGMAYRRGGSVRVLYRTAADQPLKEIAKLSEDNLDDKIWDVVRIMSGTDEGLVREAGPDGRVAIRKFNYATRTVGDVVFSVPGWDVDGALVDEKGELVAAFHTDDRQRVTWFEPRMKSLYTRLSKALNGNQVWITSRARDDSRMLVWGGSEADPGQTFLYDATLRTMDAFVADLPDLDRSLTVTPQPISYVTRDQQTIHGYLTLPRGRPAKRLPLIVLPHGGPYGVRDILEFDSLVQLLANRGYAVIQPNYRGSGGYGEAHYKLGTGQMGRAMQDDLDDAMDWAVREGIADPARVCMLGSSYGGYAALWAVIRNPERYRCAVSFAGVTDWKRMLKYDSRYLSRSVNKLWRTEVLGEEKSADLDQVSPLLQIARLNRPVLLAHGDEDSRVPLKQFTALRDAAQKAGKPVEAMVFAGEGHGFEKDENRARWFAAIEAFLAKHNPAD